MRTYFYKYTYTFEVLPEGQEYTLEDTGEMDAESPEGGAKRIFKLVRDAIKSKGCELKSFHIDEISEFESFKYLSENEGKWIRNKLIKQRIEREES
ncbi:hypothetical protein [Alteribacillus sp. HJP-4]|uniref:hypothetical protein n=1 Tax=Alteribacillus sp. HJP-4 TaxID=2775394 RepID=UPI0035CD3316